MDEQVWTTLAGVLVGGFLTFLGGVAATRWEGRRKARLEALHQVGVLGDLVEEIMNNEPPFRPAQGERLMTEARTLYRTTVLCGRKEYLLSFELEGHAERVWGQMALREELSHGSDGHAVTDKDREIRREMWTCFDYLLPLEKILRAKLRGRLYATGQWVRQITVWGYMSIRQSLGLSVPEEHRKPSPEEVAAERGEVSHSP